MPRGRGRSPESSKTVKMGHVVAERVKESGRTWKEKQRKNEEQD
jgi:hypothetical protein